MTPPSGLVLVDKPAGWTSHDVVAKVRRFAGTRRVGHAGTLDPMATGLLVLGVERATKLLTYLVGATKAYRGTIRLGVATVTDDAEGEVTSRADASGLDPVAVEVAVARLRGDIMQVPSSVSAVKVDGKRSYARVRAGEEVVLPARPVTVSTFRITGAHAGADEGLPVLDLDVDVECSSGTYVRSLARDLGAALGVGGHLTSLRRTRVGPYQVDQAHTLEQLAGQFALLPIADAARAAFPGRELSTDEVTRLVHGRQIDAGGAGAQPVAAFAPDGSLVAIIADAGSLAHSLLVLA